MAIETGWRPSEGLNLKMSDVKVKVSPTTGKQYAEVWIGRQGKTRKGRPVTIFNAIPFFNTWTAVHPARDRPDGAYLFVSQENKSIYKNTPLKEGSLRLAYVRVIREHFPKLLDRPDISLEEKATIRSLISKPCHPYLQRHAFATDIVHKISQLSFNQLMGHSRTSRMYDVYVQDLGVEGNRELQIARGIITREESMSTAEVKMQPKFCPICHESNKHDAKFCFKCNFIISHEGYLEAKEEEEKAAKDAKEKEVEIAKLKDGQAALQRTMSSLFKVLVGQSDTLTIDMGEEEYLDPKTRESVKDLWEKQQQQMAS
jgi:Phage integrase family